MPIFSNDSAWWLVLGILAGWLLFWIVDKMFRRDGSAAAQRERDEIKKLNDRLNSIRAENSEQRSELEDRSTEHQRLLALTEELRDSLSSRDQQVTNLKNALDAAREQGRPAAPAAPAAPSTKSKSPTSLTDHRDIKAGATMIAGMAASAAAVARATGDASTHSLPQQVDFSHNESDAGLNDNNISDILLPDDEAGETVTPNDDRFTIVEVLEPTESAPVRSLGKRLGADVDDLGPPDNDEPRQQSLLDRLRGSLSGRRPDDLD